mmetsp:Transcript_82306/g.197410  ORF Transcript_82306/g.197410 Transcript_82306/m.197410 type:complete len:229 (-) Transcript_82306:1829-2515(-)
MYLQRGRLRRQILSACVLLGRAKLRRHLWLVCQDLSHTVRLEGVSPAGIVAVRLQVYCDDLLVDGRGGLQHALLASDIPHRQLEVASRVFAEQPGEVKGTGELMGGGPAMHASHRADAGELASVLAAATLCHEEILHGDTHFGQKLALAVQVPTILMDHEVILPVRCSNPLHAIHVLESGLVPAPVVHHGLVVAVRTEASAAQLNEVDDVGLGLMHRVGRRDGGRHAA